LNVVRFSAGHDQIFADDDVAAGGLDHPLELAGDAGYSPSFPPPPPPLAIASFNYASLYPQAR